jgi:hypothetical protein
MADDSTNAQRKQHLRTPKGKYAWMRHQNGIPNLHRKPAVTDSTKIQICWNVGT